MAEAEKDGPNRRAHLRYRDPESTVMDFYTNKNNPEGSGFKAIVINESFTGLAVVYVGDRKIRKGSKVYWKETSTIHTACTVIRNATLEEDVYSLALKISE
jgi:hypothetical protein